MKNLPTTRLSDLTDDDFERQLLLLEDNEPDPNDPYLTETYDTTVLLANFRADLTPVQRRVLPHVYAGCNNTEAAEKAGCHPATVAKALESPSFKQCLRLLTRMDHLRNGPSSEQRAHLLWDIAVRNRKDAPNTAIRAVDVLNRQLGAYSAPEDATTQRGPLVQVINFQLPESHSEPRNPPPPSPPPPAQRVPDADSATDAAFEPVTVDLPPENPSDSP